LDVLGRIFAWAAAILIGALIGAASAWATLEFGRTRFVENFGPWTHSSAAGSEAAGPYTRAIIARDGLLALSAREALYFTLFEDDEGRPLSESCIYELTGRDLATRWWSVTLYADDSFLAQNSDHAHAIDASRVRAGPDGRWRARISPVRGDAVHWLSSRGARRGFSLTLRVYNPQREFRPDERVFPTLTTISCAEAS
jgi:hypothetical protein